MLQRSDAPWTDPPPPLARQGRGKAWPEPGSGPAGRSYRGSDRDPEHGGLLGIVGRRGPGAAIGVAAERGAVGVIGERPAGRRFRLAKHLGQKLDRGEGGAAELLKSGARLPGVRRNRATGGRIGAALGARPDDELPDLTVVPAAGAVGEIDARLPVRLALASGRNRLYPPPPAEGPRS